MSDKILKFSASWCGPCKALSQSLSTMEVPFPVEEIDVDTSEALAVEYKIRGVPTLVLIKDGKEVNRIVGSKTPDELRKFFAV